MKNNYIKITITQNVVSWILNIEQHPDYQSEFTQLSPHTHRRTDGFAECQSITDGREIYVYNSVMISTYKNLEH